MLRATEAWTFVTPALPSSALLFTSPWGRFSCAVSCAYECSCTEYYSKYELSMERVTATIDDETLEKIRRVAGPRGVSSFLNVAARERLARLELRGLLDELDNKYGAVSRAVRGEIARDAKRIFRAR
jgi:hypothetical protein